MLASSVQEHKVAFFAAFKASIPVLIGYMPFAMTFGFLFEQLGYAWYWPVIMSFFCYGGSGQILSLSMMAEGESLWEIYFTIALVNFRHIFYGLSLLDRYPQSFVKKIYLILGLTDETYSMLTASPDQGKGVDLKFCHYLTAFDHFYWVIFSLAGGLLGAAVSFDIPGLEFIMPALFTVLVIEQAKNSKKIIPFLSAVFIGPLALWVFPGQMLLVSIFAVTVFLGVFSQFKERMY